MTAKELAIELNGREAGGEVVWGEERDIKDAGLVAVYGYSDDNVEFSGAINDEVKAVWHDKGGPCWTFETDIPHETFTVMEDGEPFCVGIVFSMEALKEVAYYGKK